MAEANEMSQLAETSKDTAYSEMQMDISSLKPEVVVAPTVNELQSCFALYSH